MPSSFYSTREGDFLHELIFTWLRKETEGARGTQKERANQEGRHFGFRECLEDVIELTLTDRRAAKFPYLGDNIPRPSAGVIRVFLDAVRHLYLEARTKETSDERQAGMTELTKMIEDHLAHVVDQDDPNDTSWVEVNEHNRRKLVREGKIRPELNDVEWLEEELQAYSSLTSPIERLINQAKAGPNVNA